MTGPDKTGAARRARVRLAGFDFDAITEDEAVDLIIGSLLTGTGGRVVTPNIDIVHRASSDPAAAEVLRTSDLVLADGAPVVWALRLAGTPVPERVAGSALGPLLAKTAAECGLGVFLLGGNPGTAEQAAEALEKRHPNLRVGWHFPPFGFEGRTGEMQRIRRALRDFGPSVCFIGLGFPKQDHLGATLRAEFPDTWFIGAGATISFLAGEFARAPTWTHRLGLEWVHRLILEPRRLARRYLQRDLPFALRLLAGALRTRLRGTG